MEAERPWTEGKTPEEIAKIRARGEALFRHLQYLSEHPEIPPSPPEETSIMRELEKRNMNNNGHEQEIDRIER